MFYHHKLTTNPSVPSGYNLSIGFGEDMKFLEAVILFWILTT